MAKGPPARTYPPTAKRSSTHDAAVAPPPHFHWLRPHLSLVLFSQGFVAKPLTQADGTQDVLNWEVVIPGKDGTIWEGARIPMTMQFSEDYPNKPPVCKFKLVQGKPLFHPNVYPSGKICLSLLDADKGWKPSLTIKHLLIGIQSLLDDPNNLDPAQEEPFRAFKYNQEEYKTKVKAQAALLRS